GRAGAGEARAGRVDRPRRRGAPPALVHELTERPAADGAVATGRPPEGDRGVQGGPVRDGQQLPQLGLDQAVEPGEDSAEADGPSGEEEVLAGRVHRPSLARVRVAVTHERGEDDGWHLVEVV